MRIHVTGRKQFRDCRKRYFYSSIERIKPIKQAPGALNFGTAIHAGLADYYKHERNMTVGYGKFLDTNEDPDIVELGKSILFGYRDRWEDDPTWEVQEIEKSYELELSPDVTMVGTVDLLVKIRGDYWIVDHKTARNVHDVEHLELDDQITSYLWLLQQNGIKVKGFIYNVLIKESAKKPKLLKDGMLSRALTSRMTYESYMEAIDENGCNIEDYEDILDELKAQGNPFYHRFFVVRSKGELSTFEKLLEDEVKEMTRQDIVYYPNFGANCAYCPYHLLCKTLLGAGDVATTMKYNYTAKRDDER